MSRTLRWSFVVVLILMVVAIVVAWALALWVSWQAGMVLLSVLLLEAWYKLLRRILRDAKR